MSRYKTRRRARQYKKKKKEMYMFNNRSFKAIFINRLKSFLSKFKLKVRIPVNEKYKETVNFVVGILLLTILSFVLVWIKYKIQ